MAFCLSDDATNNRTITISRVTHQRPRTVLETGRIRLDRMRGQSMTLMLVATGFLSLLWLTQTLVRRNLDNRKDPR